MPGALREEYGLPGLGEALEKLHRPETMDDVMAAKERFKFEEALKINLGILGNRTGGGPSNVRIKDFSALKRFEANLPFALTDGQIGVMSDIVGDLRKGTVMNRLVQGDVAAARPSSPSPVPISWPLGGYQCAYMAPTEIWRSSTPGISRPSFHPTASR